MRPTTTLELVEAILRPVHKAMPGVARRLGVELREADGVAEVGGSEVVAAQARDEAGRWEKWLAPLEGGGESTGSRAAKPDEAGQREKWLAPLGAVGGGSRAAKPHEAGQPEKWLAPLEQPEKWLAPSGASQPEAAPTDTDRPVYRVARRVRPAPTMVDETPEPSREAPRVSLAETRMHFRVKGSTEKLPTNAYNPTNTEPDHRANLTEVGENVNHYTSLGNNIQLHQNSTTTTKPTLSPTQVAPSRPVLHFADQVVAASAPAWNEAHRITHEALTADRVDATSSTPTAPNAVSNTFNVNVNVGSDGTSPTTDRDSLEQALCDILRDAARRHGLEV